MRIEPLNPQHPAAVDGAGVSAARPAQEENAPIAPGQFSLNSARSGEPPRSGLANWDPQLNQEIASAQNADDFLRQLGDMLQSLKADISEKLATRQSGDAKLKGKVDQFAAAWRARNDSNGAGLDGQLHYSGADQVRQRFYVRGLDMRNLQSRGGERLEFSVGGRQRGTLLIEPGMSQETILRRLNQALAQADISAFMDEEGRLAFEVPQEAWENVRDTLAVKGGGVRFASGQLNRVQAEAAPDALRPDSWQVDDAVSLRSTLQEIIDALTRVQQARQMVAQAIAKARQRIDLASVPEGGEWALSFSQRFESLASQPRYQVSTIVAPALASISRSRVLSLLALGSHM
jgi:hypothetical protein